MRSLPLSVAKLYSVLRGARQRQSDSKRFAYSELVPTVVQKIRSFLSLNKVFAFGALAKTLTLTSIAMHARAFVLIGAPLKSLFPPNVPMWEHDLKDNFLGFSFEQFLSKLVPHLEQMFSPLSVKKYNF